MAKRGLRPGRARTSSPTSEPTATAGEKAASQVVVVAVPGGVELDIKVVPGASRSRIMGVWNNAMRVAVAAPPHEGRANEELIRTVAGAVGGRRSDVEIVSGHGRPLKRVRIAGVTIEQIRRLAATATTQGR